MDTLEAPKTIISRKKNTMSIIDIDKDFGTFTVEFVSELGKIHILAGEFDCEVDEQKAEPETGFMKCVDYDITVSLLMVVGDDNETRRKIHDYYLIGFYEDIIQYHLEDLHEFEY